MRENPHSTPESLEEQKRKLFAILDDTDLNFFRDLVAQNNDFLPSEAIVIEITTEAGTNGKQE